MSHLGFGNTCGSTSQAVDALFTRSKTGDGLRDIGGGFTVVQLSEGSPLIPAVVNVIGRSECGTTDTAPDPLLDWVYKPRTEDVFAPLAASPSDHRNAWFKWLAEYSVHFGIARNGAYALIDQASGQVVAATVTGPPGTVPFGRMSTGEMEQHLRKAGMEFAIEVLTRYPRNNVLGQWQDHAQTAAGLGRKHLYILFFDTLPEWQGRGCGSALLRFLGDIADIDGVVSFLETAGERNCAFYARKGGFQEVHRSPVATFDHEGGGVAMQRLPRESELSPPPSATAQCAHQFSPKRSTGPLASRCRVCGEHKESHAVVDRCLLPAPVKYESGTRCAVSYAATADAGVRKPLVSESFNATLIQ